MTESGDFTVKIRTAYNQFTRAEKKVADYVLEHHRDCLFMSITELSDACGVGETSIFRFCRTMGLGGYQDFKIRMSLSMRGTEEDEGMLAGHVQPEDDLPTLVQKLLASSQRALSETATLLDPKALDLAVRFMMRARRIVFFGVGASLNAAEKAANKFLRIEPKVLPCQSDTHLQTMLASTMTGEDVAVVYSYSGSSKDTNVMARLAREGGAKVIAITRFQKSPLTECTDVVMLCAANEGPFQSGSAETDICQSFLTDLLYTEYYHRNVEICGACNERTTSSVRDKHY